MSDSPLIYLRRFSFRPISAKPERHTVFPSVCATTKSYLQCYGSFALFLAGKYENYSELFKEFFHFFSSSHFLLREKRPDKAPAAPFAEGKCAREAASVPPPAATWRDDAP
ncbi:MAG TPA: hypothetical protein IAC44_04805 [Candidatus Merdimorpha stercoravium]|uniref:Uncharacterized protein n=1 Tax=Candidatus Merdimorpha stercoravium TaxID=2840863 RepID=A0A9D1H9W1_9FLAO|nr:hypothetical protein [Candidatus Merdimorpha stercoravium]